MMSKFVRGYVALELSRHSDALGLGIECTSTFGQGINWPAYCSCVVTSLVRFCHSASWGLDLRRQVVRPYFPLFIALSLGYSRGARN